MVTVWADRANWEPATQSLVRLAWYIAAGVLLVALAGGMSAGSALLGARLARDLNGARGMTVVLQAPSPRSRVTAVFQDFMRLELPLRRAFLSP